MKKEAAVDVSMQDKEQTEQTETGALSQEAADRSNCDKQQTIQQVGAGTGEPQPPSSGQQNSEDPEEAHPGWFWNSASPNEKP